MIGEKTGQSSWIDWEIWYSLQNFQNSKVSRRRFKPKGLLALYLDKKNHHVPVRLQENTDSGYAVEIHWDELDTLFDEKVNEAYKDREKVHLIRNNTPLKENLENIFKNLNLNRLFG